MLILPSLLTMSSMVLCDICNKLTFMYMTSMLLFVFLSRLNSILFAGVIKDEMGTYDLLFYIAIGASCYVSIATIGIIFCMRKAGTLHRYKNVSAMDETVERIVYKASEDEVQDYTDYEKQPLLKRNHNNK